MRFSTATLLEGGKVVDSWCCTGVAKLTVERATEGYIVPSCECFKTECLLSTNFDISENVVLASIGLELAGGKASFVTVCFSVLNMILRVAEESGGVDDSLFVTKALSVCEFDVV